uniref:Uncharacterized protein n=1 Tax=Esox lucius TaxID=8010 RepID=A0AAY5JXQ8_ESOLU
MAAHVKATDHLCARSGIHLIDGGPQGRFWIHCCSPQPSDPQPSCSLQDSLQPSSPLPSGPHPSCPHPSGPHPSCPHPSGPHPSGPHPSCPHPSGPHPSCPHPSGPHPSGPHPSGPHPSGPHPSGPHPSGPHPSCPHPSGPHPSGLHPSGPHPSGPMLYLTPHYLYIYTVILPGCIVMYWRVIRCTPILFLLFSSFLLVSSLFSLHSANCLICPCLG